MTVGEALEEVLASIEVRFPVIEYAIDKKPYLDAKRVLESEPDAPKTGNSVAMRKALEMLDDSIYFDTDDQGLHIDMDGKDPSDVIAEALSKPPRNCDQYESESEAQIAFLNEVWLISVDADTLLERDKFDNWTEEMKGAYAKWLMAPVTKGDAK